LIDAAVNAQNYIVNALLAKGVNVNGQNSAGNIALM
jgi:hypothetical protein